MNTNQEIVTKWRDEFESIYGSHARYLGHDYVNPIDQARWQGFLMARQSSLIELPEFQTMDDPDGQGRGEYVMREVLERSIEKQGYVVKMEGKKCCNGGPHSGHEYSCHYAFEY
jgi:hypothetical protein